MDITDEPDLAEALPLRVRIQHVLGQGARTAKEVAGELAASLPQVKARLSEGAGVWSTKVGTDRWGLLQRV